MFLLLGRRQRALAQVEEHRARFEAELRVQEGNITEIGERETTERLRARGMQYQRDFDTLAGMPAEHAPTYSFERLKPAFLATKAVADQILAINQDAMVRKSDQAERAARRMDTIMVGAGIGALLLGLTLSIMLTNRVLRPLGVLTQAVRRVGEGDLAARAQIAGQDEVAQLAREFNAMTARLAEYRSSSLGELLQAQQASQAAIDSLPDPVVVYDVGGRILNVNQTAESISLDEPAIRSALESVRSHVLGGKGPYAPKGFE